MRLGHLETKSKSGNIIRYVQGILTLLFLGVLTYYFFSINRADLLFVIRNVAWIYIIPAVGIIIMVLCLKSIRLKFLSPKPIPLFHFFRIQTISILLATFTPGRLGEISKIWFLKNEGISSGSSLYIFFVERVTDVLILLFFGMMYYFFAIMHQMAFGIAMVLMFFGFLFLLVLHFKGIICLPIPHVFNKIFDKFHIERHIHKKLPISIGLSIIIWLFEGVFLLMIIRMVKQTIPYHEATGIVAISSIASLLSILPLGLGSVDFSIGFLLQKSGMSLETVAAVLLLTRTIVVVTLSFAGMCSSGFSFRDIRMIMKQEKEKKSIEMTKCHCNVSHEKLAKPHVL